MCDICIAGGGHVENFNTKCSFEAIQLTSSKWGSSFQFEQEANKLVVDHISVNSLQGSTYDGCSCLSEWFLVSSGN